MSLSVNQETRRRLALLFSIPLAFSLLFFFVNQTAEHRETKLLQVQKLSTSVGLLRSNARDAESGERGYILTREDRYLTPFKQAQAGLDILADNCLRDASQRPLFRPKVEKLVAIARQHIKQTSQTVEDERRGNLDANDLSRQLSQSEDTMIAFRGASRDLLNDLSGEELELLRTQQAFSRWTFVFFSLGSLLMIGVIVWLYHALLKYLSERDAATANLKTANLYLEARIEERTRDLTKANEELQQFAYVASHDLQEPLRTITSFSQLLVARYGGRLDSDADEFIGYIVTASRRMTDLINGLLALVRLRRSGQPTDPVSFEDMLAEAEISLQAAIRESDARLEHGPLPSLVVDSVQFSQVFQNLISNAIKYRRESSPVVRVDAERDASHWTFCVQDNGRGFDPQFAERIFGLFQRLNNREVDGTGMGLSISRRIVERHGGRMWAKSTEGVGSAFFFSLPVTLEASRERTELSPQDELKAV